MTQEEMNRELPGSCTWDDLTNEEQTFYVLFEDDGDLDQLFFKQRVKREWTQK